MTAPADTARSTRLTRLAAARPFRFAISLLCLLAISAEAAVAATFTDLVGEAFKRSQTPWDPRTPAPVVEFDPPDGSDPLGLDFVEYGKLMARPFHDDYIWWVRASPHGNFEKDPLELWTYQPERKGHAPVPYRAEDFPYRHPAIRPPLPDPIPVAARHISAVDLGFRRENLESWPQILHLGGNGYGRLAGFPPLVFGTSFRLGVRHVGQPNEDFAKLRKLYLRPLNERAFRLMGLVDCQAYAAALVATLQPGTASTLRVNMTIFLTPWDCGSRIPTTRGRTTSRFTSVSTAMWSGRPRSMMASPSPTPQPPIAELRARQSVQRRFRHGRVRCGSITLPKEPLS